MRTNITDRYYRTLAYLDTDRVPDIEFGYWPQTVRRWIKEGLDFQPTAAERTAMFIGRLDQQLGFDSLQWAGLNLRTGMLPPFEEQVIEKRPKSTIVRDANGVLAERFMDDGEECSIPHFIKFPVEGPPDWKKLKERYGLDHPGRQIPQSEIEAAQASAADGKVITMGITGPYGQLRDWMGFENVSVAFYDYPDMIHEMLEHMAELIVAQIRRLPSDFVIDYSTWWEDMASKNGPFVSPSMFREFLQPFYRTVMTELRKHGGDLALVDCDGDPSDLVPIWLEEGVNVMFPAEVAAGVDPYQWRRRHGKELRIRGGIAKAPLVEGGSAIDRELERMRPLLDQGGYIPHLDHLVPPNISYKNYCYYLEKKRKLIGKA
jgi:uroporphyrinogen decarboxylase